jgi:hypothetical protein
MLSPLALQLDSNTQTHIFVLFTRPSAKITDQSITIVAPTRLTFQVMQASKLVDDAFAIQSNITLGLEASIIGSDPLRVGLNFTLLAAPLAVFNSTVGDVKVQGLSAVVNALFSDVVLPLVNKVVNRGIPLPTVAGVTFTKTKIILQNGVFLIATEFTV